MPTHPFRVPRWLAAAVVMATSAVLFPVVTPDVEAATAPTLAFNGRGWGHGRGLSQWGAEGYARNHGWDYRQILGHYYSNTAVGTAGNPVQHVRLMAMDQKSDYHITAPTGTRINIHDGDVNDPGTHRFLRLIHNPTRGGWHVYSRATTTDSWTFRGASGGAVTVGRFNAGTLSVNGRSYPGSIRAWHKWTSGARYYRTMAITRAEDYLRGVVPNESPASWTQAALRAQAVAARSYLLAGDGRHNIGGLKYADTCDTTLCQVYNPNVTDPRTDTAVSATAGEVRRMNAGGAIARTEFSSTSGGWTAGGVFPAVEDLGDSISPVHTWSTSVSAAPLQNTYAGGSQLTSISVTRRNGLGEWGGRALDVRLRFANGTDRTVSGDDIRSVLGLRSNWFTVAMPGGPPVPPPGIRSKALSVGGASYQPLVGDFDGDGLSDAIWYAPGSTPDYLWWSGPGGTHSTTRLRIGGDYKPLVGDVDGNGADDIVWYGDGSPSYVWRGTSSRSFTSTRIWPPGSRRTFLVDIGGDGTDDIVAYGPGAASDRIITWRNGSFSSRAINVGSDYRPFVGDFDGNGSGDIFWYSPGARADYLWRTFAGGQVRTTRYTINLTYRPTVGDLDGNGAEDIVWYAPGSAGDHTWFGSASGVFDSRSTPVGGEYQPVVADLGADGRDDIVWYEPGAAPDLWWRFGADRRLASAGLSLPGWYVPKSGTFGSGRDGILWYGPGSSPDALWYA